MVLMVYYTHVLKRFCAFMMHVSLRKPVPAYAYDEGLKAFLC